MGIESEPKFTPGEDENTPDSRKPVEPTGETPNEQSPPHLSEADEIKKQMAQQDEMMFQNIREQEYQKVKEERDRFRKEHGIQKKPEEIEQEDRELRKRFGLK